MAILLGCGGGDSAQNFASCGNGIINDGEVCDDNNLNDTDDCTSACRPARCGDGVVHVGVEQCDGTALNGATCAGLGLAGERPACSATCEIDASACGSAFTPTATATSTPPGTPTQTFSPTLRPDVPTPTATTSPTPTASFTPTQMPCGDGVLRPDETCDDCPADCTVQPCEPGGETIDFVFDLVAPPGQSPTGVTVRLGYRSELIDIPGMGGQRPVLERVNAPDPAPVPFIVNDAGYAVSVVLGRTTPITELFTITFDRCTGAPEPTVDDFGCAIVGCASGGPPIEGCECLVRVP